MTVVPRYLTRVHGIDDRTAKLCAILHTLRLAVLLTLIPATVALAFHMEAAQIVL